MRKVASVACCVVALILTADSYGAGRKQPLVEGGRLEFSLPDLDGRVVDSADERFAGKVVLVNLWATWCPPCLSEIPTFNELQRAYGDRGLVVVSMAFEQGDAASRRKFLRSFSAQQEIDYLVLDGGPPDEMESVLPAMQNVRGLPVEILIDRSGRVVATRNGFGYKKKWAKRLHAEIEGLLQAPTE